MKLLSRYRPKADPNVSNARREVDDAILKLSDLLDQVQYQTEQVKEALEDERRAG